MSRFKILVAACLLIAITNVFYAQSGWQVQYDSLGEEYYDIYFINGNTGWAIETWQTGKILKTTNSGLNWFVISTLQFHDGTGIAFYNESIGWISASSALLMRTTNGGYNWIYCDCGICTNADDFIDVQFINQSTGWAYGDQRVFKTTNGGVNYFPLQCSIVVNNGFFLDALNGWVGGYNGTGKSTNGGSIWGQYAYVSLVQGIHFANLNTGWICTFDGKIYKSTNSGENWNQQYSGNRRLYKTQFVNENTGWVIGDTGTILKTTNGGVNWYMQSSPAVDVLRGIFMISPTEGWICGRRYILHTTDGGGPIGIKPISSEVPEKFSLYQNYPNPFNPSTKIKFDIPPVGQRHAFDVRLTIYDALGREISTLVNEELKPGTYEVSWEGSNYPSGVYFYKLIAGDPSASSGQGFTETKKMILLK